MQSDVYITKRAFIDIIAHIMRSLVENRVNVVGMLPHWLAPLLNVGCQ